MSNENVFNQSLGFSVSHKYSDGFCDCRMLSADYCLGLFSFALPCGSAFICFALWVCFHSHLLVGLFSVHWGSVFSGNAISVCIHFSGVCVCMCVCVLRVLNRKQFHNTMLYNILGKRFPNYYTST